MTKKYSTKKALIASLLSLALCFSMLVGTTFAWFTDSVTSANNIIKSGNLDISLEHADTALGATDAGWTDASTGAIFNYSKWEPGYTAVKYVKIENEGTLDLKFILNIIPNNEAEEVNLADVIEVYMFDSAFAVDRDALTTDSAAYVGTLTSLMNEKDGAAHGVLYADDADKAGNVYEIYTIALKMSTSAGNEYMDKSVGGGFAVQLLATQLTSESDSFDNQYDEAAGTPFVAGKGTEDDPYLINEASQLLGISEFSDEYTYFKIADGVETLDMTGIGKIKLNGSFDGNGVTMNNLTTALFQSVGKVGVAQDIKISNLTANVNTTDGNALVRNIYNPGTTTFENVVLHGYIEGKYNMGSFYNYGTANAGDSDGADYTVSFVNATSDATLVCTTGNAIGGMLGHGYEGADYTLSINMDSASEYTGKMYTTGTATCYEVMAMCSHATYVLNGVETSRSESQYPSTKLTAAAPTAKVDGYYVAPVEDVDHYVVSLEAQLTAYDENNVKIPNLAGLTWSLGKTTLTAGFDGKIFDLVTSAEIVNDEDLKIGYDLSGGVLKVYTGRDTNYKSGWITLNVTQYDANGTILATGNVRVYTFAEP